MRSGPASLSNTENQCIFLRGIFIAQEHGNIQLTLSAPEAATVTREGGVISVRYSLYLRHESCLTSHSVIIPPRLAAGVII